MSGTFVALRHNHPGANSVGPLCSIVSKCCRGELSWEQVDCSECSRRMWRQPLRESSTRDWHEDRCCIKPDVDTSRVCFDCKKELRVKNLMPPQPPPVLAGAREYTSEIGEDLGISVETFRALKLLQQREITPNDYDLLMRLHTKSSTKTLDEKTLSTVCETFHASADDPRKPNASERCAVCLCAMAEGEELTRLSCQGKHTFHSHCILEWLRTASHCCPIDSQDLSTLCMTA